MIRPYEATNYNKKKKLFGIPVLWVKPENECRTLAWVHKVIYDALDPGNINHNEVTK